VIANPFLRAKAATAFSAS